MSCFGCAPKGTRKDPVVFGSPGGDPVFVQSLISLSGVRDGQKVWAAGSSLEPMIAAGLLQRI